MMCFVSIVHFLVIGYCPGSFHKSTKSLGVVKSTSYGSVRCFSMSLATTMLRNLDVTKLCQFWNKCAWTSFYAISVIQLVETADELPLMVCLAGSHLRRSYEGRVRAETRKAAS